MTMLRRIPVGSTAGCLALPVTDLAYYEHAGRMPLGGPMFVFLLVIGGVAWLAIDHKRIKREVIEEVETDMHKHETSNNLEALRKMARH